MSACLCRSSVTPRPWLPSEGLTTTGRPMSWAASQASSGLLTTWPSGMGTPQDLSRLLVRSLSLAMPSAMALVNSVSAVQMRRWLVALGQRHARHAFVARPEHHAVYATLAGAAGLAKTGGHARQVEQLDHDVLQHMAAPGAFLQALQESTAFAHAAVVFDQCGQPGGKSVVETGQQVGGIVLQLAQVQPDFQYRPVGPDIGAAQVVDAKQLDVVEFRHGLQRVSWSGRVRAMGYAGEEETVKGNFCGRGLCSSPGAVRSVSQMSVRGVK